MKPIPEIITRHVPAPIKEANRADTNDNERDVEGVNKILLLNYLSERLESDQKSDPGLGSRSRSEQVGL